MAELRLTSGALSLPHPPQPSLLPILGEPWRATLGQCQGSEVDRLTFFAWAQRQRYPGLSDFSTEQLINPESEI